MVAFKPATLPCKKPSGVSPFLPQLPSTFTEVTALNKEQRTDEVARILGGIKISDKTRMAAEEMIKASA